MVAASRLFVEQLSWRSCNELVHPHSCRRAAWQNLYRFAWSNLKYYLPMVILDLLRRALRGTHLLQLLRDALLYYAQLVFGGLVNGCLTAGFICLLRHLLGEFRPHTLLFVPALLGGAFVALVPIRVKELQHTVLFQALIESLLLQRSNPLTKALASSRWLQTLLFMACSAIIMLGKQRQWHRGFWFVMPDSLQSEKSSKSATQYVVQGMRKYLLIGLALDIFRALISCIKTGRWHLKQLSLESMAWLGCYVGIYRTTLCYMQSKTDVGQTLQQIVSSFLGGLSFVCYPKLTILSYALLEAGRSLWGKYHRKRRKSRFGYSDLVYPLVLAYLIHTYTFHPKRVSAITGIIIDSTTANYAGNISKRLQQLQRQPARWHGKWI
ncbi:uncharacterized protein LOC111594420 [Drosophila hydei]|uniref:Uncharacterized protein LOC111594420 n=1 Tax=Drosophila hydei TaxID=7224 RepID=A0A6J1LDQ1_DROHY|nr:uncharacterized protein LOC111594420 [Drosophila hydei]